MKKSIRFLFTLLILSANSSPILAQWVRTLNSPDYFTSFLVSDADLFAGSYGGGIYYSSDDGATWTARNNGLTNRHVSALAATLDGSGGKYIFAGTTDGGVFRSAYNGSSWDTVNTGLTTQRIYSLIVSGSGILAGTDSGVFISRDNGANWTVAGLELRNNRVQCFLIFGTTLFAGTRDSGIFRSDDNGMYWTAAGSGLPKTSIVSMIVSGPYILAGTADGGVYRSSDVGASWGAVNGGLTYFRINTLVLSGVKLFAATTGGGLFLSINNGTRWYDVSKNLPSVTLTSLAASDTNLFAGIYGSGVWKRRLSEIDTFLIYPPAPTLGSPMDGATRISTNPTLMWNASDGAISYRLQVSTDSGFSTVVVDSSGMSGTTYIPDGLANSTLYFWRVNASNANGPSRWSESWNFTTVAGSAWTVASSGLTSMNVGALAANSTTLFAGTSGGSLFLSNDDGTTWISLRDKIFYSDVNALMIDGTNIFAGSQGGAHLSTDNGLNWKTFGLSEVRSFTVSDTNVFAAAWGEGVYRFDLIPPHWTEMNNGLTTTYVSAVGAFGTYLFAGVWDGLMYRSADRGESWTRVQMDSHAWGANCFAVVGQKIFAGDQRGLLISSDSGASWTFLSNFYNTNVASLVASGMNLFAGLSGGDVSLSRDGGVTWTSIGTGLPNSTVRSLALNADEIYAGTLGDGVWKRSLTGLITSIENPSIDLPGEFRLFQNYPNPFNPATTISYTLPKKSFVTLKVFDGIGREVATLVNGEVSAGNHSQQWNANGLPSGIYYCRFQAGPRAETMKLVLLK